MWSVSGLLGRTFTNVEQRNNDSVIFIEGDGTEWGLWHDNICCESVYLEDIIGNLQDLVGAPLLMAEESISDDPPLSEYHDSYTWTFYKFATMKGYVTLRWYGSSNGYYSETVNLHRNGSNCN